MEDQNFNKSELLKKAQANHWKWKSPYSVRVTVDRLLAVVDRYPEVLKYDRIDQQAVAKISGHSILPAETVFFQNSKLVGKLLSTNIMAMEQLPIKTIIWEDESGKVWLKTVDIDYMNEHYNLNGGDGAIQAIYDLLPGWVEEAVQE
ncbi:DUF302 domain-containing protein [Halomonas binhaiensis]|uniref:DUF302 domain-containing protein n=1 Tax=Halomonas binhaiensis TaxID=2562282 RepID=A0A5C1NG29_9GAMM|nr:DUF302 domain-containing protein [Halomonas binhaiensis]QEM81840.1 DUF302 domain-containing protein [Halomonas binhaiensis]